MSNWKPPSDERVEIKIHPHARLALSNLLLYEPSLRGVGYSEFIMAAVESYKTAILEERK